MSINHMIDSGATPKYDIFVNGIITEGDLAVGGSVDVSGSVDVEGAIISQTSVTAPTITASQSLLIGEQTNINDVLRYPPFSINSILFSAIFL